ncbi:MAG: hypothetical protein ACPG5T_06565 [Endozoicomonas sp.]
MSKYIYTTIYEQFTGLKPPEPKNHKPRRRRGYGHPYRMRLNMQEDECQNENDNEIMPGENDRDYAEQPPVATFQPSMGNKAPVRRFSAQQHHSTFPGNSIMTTPPMSDEPMTRKGPEPKVTYKKRRHYNEA